MQDGRIPSSALRVSSEHSAPYGPAAGRLYQHPSSGVGGSWLAKTLDNRQWFEVDFGKQIRITGVASQGRQDATQYVKTYSLQYGNDGFLFSPYQEGGFTKVGDGSNQITKSDPNQTRTRVERWTLIRTHTAPDQRDLTLIHSTAMKFWTMKSVRTHRSGWEFAVKWVGPVHSHTLSSLFDRCLLLLSLRIQPSPVGRLRYRNRPTGDDYTRRLVAFHKQQEKVNSLFHLFGSPHVVCDLQ